MPRFRFQDTEHGCIGAIDIPTSAPGRITVAALGDSRADALARASLLAEHISQDPIMSALMPPQALVAIKAAKGLSAAAKRGTKTLRHFWGRLRGAGKRRLAAALHEDAKVADLELGYVDPDEVGFSVRRLLRRKRRKRKVPPMRARGPRYDEQAEDEDAEAQNQPADTESEETGDVADADVEGGE